MRNDQELHQLFRARLPIATLPQEFADRLTKTVLDEVARLRQDTLLAKGAPGSCVEEATSFIPLAKSTKSSTFSCTAKVVAFFLLLNCLLWPLAQGCAFPTTVTAVSTLSSNHSALDGRLVATTPPLTKIDRSFLRTGFTLHSTGRSVQIPPLPPIKPQLPILQFLQRVFVSKSGLTHLSTPSTEHALINLHGPPTMGPESPAAITLTIPYESQPANQNIPLVTVPAPTPVPTEQQSEPTAIPTADIIISKPAQTPTPLVFSPTPTLSIFEPTTTPSPTSEEPVGAATDVPTVMPTICLIPWQTEEAEAISIPTASVPLTTTP